MKKVISLMLAGAMLLSAAGCSGGNSSSSAASQGGTESAGGATSAASTEQSSAASSGDITIGISMDAIESQMWVENEKSMHNTADSLGVKYKEVVAEGDAQKQNQQIDTLIASGVKAIIIAPKDGTAIVSAIKKCNAANIPVIMNNRAAGNGATVASTVSSDNKAMVIREMNYILDKAKKSGKKYKVLELIGNLTDVNAVARDEGFKQVAKANPDIFNVVASVPTEWKAEMALSGTLNAFQSHSDINMIFNPSDVFIPSIESALKQKGKWFTVDDPKHITIVTFDGAKESVNLITQKYVDIVSVQNATTQGKLCVETAVKLAKGEKVEANQYDPGFEVNLENVATSTFKGY